MRETRSRSRVPCQSNIINLLGPFHSDSRPWFVKLGSREGRQGRKGGEKIKGKGKRHLIEVGNQMVKNILVARILGNRGTNDSVAESITYRVIVIDLSFPLIFFSKEK